MGTPEIFGEGITIFKNKIYQLTWESNVAYLYDINNKKWFKQIIEQMRDIGIDYYSENN